MTICHRTRGHTGCSAHRRSVSQRSKHCERHIMELQPDFKELLGLLNEHGVEYLIIGGYALAFHGAPRFTGDLDLLISTTLQNADKVYSALKAFGFGSVGLSPDDFMKENRIV